MRSVRRTVELEAHRDRCRANASEPRLDNHLFLQCGRRVEIEVQRLARNPDAALEAEDVNGQPARTPHLGLGDTDQAHIGTVKHDSHRVAIRPSDAIAYLERIRWRSIGEFGMA